MMRSVVMGLLAVVVAVFGSAEGQRSSGADQKAARITLVQEFVREMEVIYRLQETSKKEIAEDGSPNGKLMTAIRMGTRTILEMNDSINRLDRIVVTEQWGPIRDLLKTSHQQRTAFVQEMTDAAKTILKGPQPGVDYGALMVRAPEITAQMESLDKIMFTTSQAMFLALVDDVRVGSDGNLHYLLLTKSERARMVQLIDKSFGPNLENNNASHIVSAAWVIKYGLTRLNYKSADEP